MEILPIAILIITIAFLAESTFGFGGGLIAIPFLSLFLGVRDAVTLSLIFQFLMGILIIKTYKTIDWKAALPMTVGIILGTLFGTYGLFSVDEVLLRKFLAIFILLFLAKTLIDKNLSVTQSFQKQFSFAAGAVGGLFQGMIGTGGPILTSYLSVLIKGKDILRATLMYLFFVTSIVRIFISLATGLFNPTVITMAIPTMPFFFLAIILGSYAHKKIEEQRYQYSIYVLLLFAAILLLLK